MPKFRAYAVLAAGCLSACAPDQGEVPLEPAGPVSLTLIENAVFYDGYAAPVDVPPTPGVVRLGNTVNTVKLTGEQVAALQSTLKVTVIVGALCDNYDRLGFVNLAMVDKGAATYDRETVMRIEIARFITPFMDLNVAPTEVPYEWQLDSVISILKDVDLNERFDFWFELEIFGVPYAAQEEVAGCAGRNDTQAGTLKLYSDRSAPAPAFNHLIPVAIRHGLNNYTDGASDELATSRKTFDLTVEADSPNAQLVLITSNHGSNDGGEEYNRRQHLVSFDGVEVLDYTPGRESCEPFRQYNTQPNGIYGRTPATPQTWQSFSNWCPGDVIDTRIIQLGAVDAGVHQFVIDVPRATFAAQQGDIPVSLYMQLE